MKDAMAKLAKQKANFEAEERDLFKLAFMQLASQFLHDGGEIEALAKEVWDLTDAKLKASPTDECKVNSNEIRDASLMIFGNNLNMIVRTTCPCFSVTIAMLSAGFLSGHIR